MEAILVDEDDAIWGSVARGDQNCMAILKKSGWNLGEKRQEVKI